MSIAYLTPNWPAPKNIKAFTTLRTGGVSEAPFYSLNLAAHVGDSKDRVEANRMRLKASLDLPQEPLWLTQVHGIQVVDATTATPNVEADGSFSKKAGVVCAVMTADCLPVLVCHKDGKGVAAIHAGWRGLGIGVLEAGIEALQLPPEELYVWLGPGIGPRAFEVDSDVVAFFTKTDAAAESAFRRAPNDRYYGDLYAIAKQRLCSVGVRAQHVYGGEWCTVSDPLRFYSFRRDGITGRMASAIYITTGHMASGIYII